MVGINTASPTARLEIVESKIKTWTPTSQTELLVERDGNCLVSIIGKSDSNTVLNFGDEDDENIGNIDYDHADNSMTLRTNSSERLRISSDGKVGINETNPSTILHVENDNANSGTYYLNTDAAILVQNKNSNASAKTVLKLEGPIGS